MPRFFLAELPFTHMNSSIFVSQRTVLLPFIARVPLAVLLALSWLIVNHPMPWPAFYSDALAALVLWVVSLVVLAKRGKFVSVPVLFWWCFAASLLPWLQFGTGEIYFFGTAWIHSLYLLGFAVAVLVGYNWERAVEGECLDFLFLAVVMAAILSVAMQLIQSMALDIGSIFVLQPGRERYDANLGQPNQLGSLLLLGTCGVAWGYARGFLRACVSVVLLVCLLTGIALTGSRAAWLNVAGLAVFLPMFWQERRPKHLRLTLAALAGYFFAFSLSLPTLNHWLFGGGAALRDASDPLRLMIWRIFANAVINGPFLGYGWGQSISAALVNPDYPNQSVMSYAHNLFLDLMAYNGLLIGGLISVGMIYIVWSVLKHIQRPEATIPFAAAAVLLVHAMVEYPLHYGYFLLPFGMFVGILCFHSHVREFGGLSRQGFVAALLVLGGALMITIHDGLEAERTYFSINYSKRNKEVPVDERPVLYVLDQWRERLKLANMFRPEIEDSANRQWIWSVLVTTPDPAYALNLAQNYAANGQPMEARYWLDTMCKLARSEVAQRLEGEWRVLRNAETFYAAVDWAACSEPR